VPDRLLGAEGLRVRRGEGERGGQRHLKVQLPGLTAYEATRQLRADPATARTPVVAVTALV